MKECTAQKNIDRCTCTYEACNKKGSCCECLHYHLGMGQLPACVFPKDVEKTYDRSIETFIKTYQTRGKWW